MECNAKSFKTLIIKLIAFIFTCTKTTIVTGKGRTMLYLKKENGSNLYNFYI